jgi:hypothetical protein
MSLGKSLGADQDIPDFAHDGLEEFQIALLGGDDAFPVPLVDISGVVVVQEIVFAYGPHLGADAFAGAAVELLEGHPFPFGGSLYDLGVEGMFVAIVRNMELNGSAGAVAIEHVVDATFRVDD